MGNGFVEAMRVFYAIVVKGYARFRGTLIGALSLVFWANLGAGVIRNWDFGIPFEWFGVALVLTGGIFLYIFLPRWFTGTYQPGPTLREAVAVPGVKARFASAGAVYLVAATIIAAGSLHLGWVTAAAAAVVGADYYAWYQALGLAGRIGALVWGVAADFFSVRWLLIALAVLSLPAAAWVWLSDDPVGGALLLSLVRGRPDQPPLGAGGGSSAQAAFREACSGHSRAGRVGQFVGLTLPGCGNGCLGNGIVHLDCPD